MDKRSFLNRNPGLSTFIIFIYLLSTFRMVEIITSIESSFIIVYFLLIAIVTFITSNLLIKMFRSVD